MRGTGKLKEKWKGTEMKKERKKERKEMEREGYEAERGKKERLGGRGIEREKSEGKG